MNIEELLDYSELVQDGLMAPEFIPPQDGSRCFVSRGLDGHIDGYIFVQFLVTVEPIWVAEKQRGSSLAFNLFSHVSNTLLREGKTRWFMTHSDTPEVESYLRRIGMEELNWKTFKFELHRAVTGG